MADGVRSARHAIRPPARHCCQDQRVPRPADSPLYDWAELRLGEDLEAWLRAGRAAGKSWARLSAELYQRTGVRVITAETLRRWAAE